MKKALTFLFMGLFLKIFADDTFSIVAVDSVTGEIGSAGCSCIDHCIIISDIVPGIGAVHTQAYWNVTNQANANGAMSAGYAPDAVISYAVANDAGGGFDSSYRQYGAVTYNFGHPLSAAYTGANCADWKGHITGANFSIQGNILLGAYVLDSMKSRFVNTPGCLADKMMAALQGANFAGADTRCLAEGVPGTSAFVRVAKPTDAAGSFYLDLNVNSRPYGLSPIDSLQTLFDNWKAGNPCTTAINKTAATATAISPNPFNNILLIELNQPEVKLVQLCELNGKVLLQNGVEGKQISLNTEQLQSGCYLLHFLNDSGQILAIKKVLKQ